MVVGFDKEKFKTVLHYFISQCGHQGNVGKTVLFKLLYFSDFNFYELYEESMTGESYQKLPYGPAPLKNDFDTAISELQDENRIEHKKIYFSDDGYQFRYSSLRKPPLNDLSLDELDVINKVLLKCSKMSANEISDYSHEDMPWQATDMKGIIDYELVFYRTPKLSVRKYDEN